MSLLDNLKGLGNDSASSFSSTPAFNPFKLLDIGESMLHYCEGIRIKDYTFFGVLTSERFILIDNSPKGKGAIAKEMPSDLIQKADLAHESGFPVLVLHVLLEGQIRHMRLIFSGLIGKPEEEVQAWYTTINGHPPELKKEQAKAAQEIPVETPVTTPEYEKDAQRGFHAATTDIATHSDPEEPAEVSTETFTESSDAVSPVSDPSVKKRPRRPKAAQVSFSSDGIIDADEEEVRLTAAKITQEVVPPATQDFSQKTEKRPQKESFDSGISAEKSGTSHATKQAVQIEKREVDPRRALSIHVQKPKLTPLGRSVMTLDLPRRFESDETAIMSCLMCGARIPVKSRFCRVCGEQQNIRFSHV
jgi:ribosomal protein L40E